MAVSLDEVRDLKRSVGEEYEARHIALSRLRDFWHGRYWERGSQDAGSVTSIFRDLTASASDVGPDIKLVRNLLFDVVTKFQTYLSPLPMIRVYTDPPQSQTKRQQATTKERFLYGVWSSTEMSRQFVDLAWFLPLMGHVYHGIYPDFDKNLPCALIRSPEHAFPLQSWDKRKTDAVIFHWKAKEAALLREFPNYRRQADVARESVSFAGRVAGRRPKPSEPSVDIYEYSDDVQFGRWAGDQQLANVEHNFGFNLFEEMKFINVPGEVWGHGAVEQSVNLVEAGNALYSLMMQAVIENVFPKLVLEDPMKAPEQIDQGPGSVIPLNPGGKAYYLQPPAAALGAQAGILQENERAIKQNTGMPDVNFGQFEGSIVTGKAINELQGAGTGSTVEMVQGVGIGTGIVKWNEKAITIAQRMFADDEMYLFGTYPETMADLKPNQFAMKLKGSDLKGSPHNEVVFMPTMQMHEKVVMGLQMAGAGLVSKKWQREQVGIPDSEAMDEELIGEALQDAVLGSVVQALTAAGAVDPQQAMSAEQEAVAYLAGKVGPPEGNGAPAPVSPAGPPPAASPPPAGPGPAAPPSGGAPAGPGAGGAVVHRLAGRILTPDIAPAGGPPGGGPGLAAPTPGPAAGGAPGGAETIKLDDVVPLFQQMQTANGRIFLVGELVSAGQTDQDVEVALTDASDRDGVTAALQRYAGRFQLHHVAGEPDEPYLEVTPGQPPTPGGQEPAGQPEEAATSGIEL